MVVNIRTNIVFFFPPHFEINNTTELLEKKFTHHWERESHTDKERSLFSRPERKQMVFIFLKHLKSCLQAEGQKDQQA